MITCFPFLSIPSVQAQQAETHRAETQAKLINDAFLTTLYPYISNAVAEYYREPKMFGLYNAKIISISRTSNGSFSFIVKVEVRTFAHAHNPPYGLETITMKVDPSKVTVIRFDHRGDAWDAKIIRFKREVVHDIQRTFELNLETYKQYDLNALRYLSQSDARLTSLVQLNERIEQTELRPYKKPPYKNVVDPITFIKGKQGYILVKKGDGTNILYSVMERDGVWKLVSKQSRQGKKMPKDLLWYMKCNQVN